MNLLKSPIIRLVGIIAILYFALFSNDSKKESLGSRFSKENVKKDLGEVKEKSQYIISNIKKAQKIKEEEYYQQRETRKIDFKTKDFEIGDGEMVVCNSSVTINYKAYFTSFGQETELEFVESYQFVVGDSKVNEVLNHNVIGMKQGGIRAVKLPTDYKAKDEKLKEYFINNDNQEIIYEINLLSIDSDAKDSQYDC